LIAGNMFCKRSALVDCRLRALETFSRSDISKKAISANRNTLIILQKFRVGTRKTFTISRPSAIRARRMTGRTRSAALESFGRAN
jgi:hypothetical protein